MPMCGGSQLNSPPCRSSITRRVAPTTATGPRAEPRAVVVFLHGFGEHTGVYHRYGFALNAAGIDLWAVDQFGHGLSPGERGDFGSIADSSDLADTLTELAEGERPGLPLIARAIRSARW